MPNPLGLSQNAWRNAKVWSDVAFPANPVTGDRILRTDIGSGVWFTYVTSLWVPDVWAAFAVLNNGTGVSNGATAVTYNLPSGAGFLAIPRVVISLATAPSGAGADRLVIRSANGTTTGFQAQLYTGNAVAATWTGQVAHYIAVPAAPA